MTVGDTQCIVAAMEPPRKLQRVSACPKATQKMTIRVRQRHQILYVAKDQIKDTRIYRFRSKGHQASGTYLYIFISQCIICTLTFTRGAFTYYVRCFLGIFYLPTLACSDLPNNQILYYTQVRCSKCYFVKYFEGSNAAKTTSMRNQKTTPFFSMSCLKAKNSNSFCSSEGRSRSDQKKFPSRQKKFPRVQRITYVFLGS